jgi:hypothetical protein
MIHSVTISYVPIRPGLDDHLADQYAYFFLEIPFFHDVFLFVGSSIYLVKLNRNLSPSYLTYRRSNHSLVAKEEISMRF